MGTNFYWKDKYNGDTDNPEIHIGKRSAAGPFCWDCDQTLCKGRVHFDSGFWDSCPKCGGVPIEEDMSAQGHAGGVELGFAIPNTTRPEGVRSASSFSWAQKPEDVDKRLDSGGIVIDEYGRSYTAEEFRVMLDAQCPIRRTDSIGAWFC